MSVPISLGMISTILFQIVDTYFVGQLGAVELASLGFAATTYFVLVGLFIGLAVAVSLLVARAYGAGKTDRAMRTTALALILAFAVASMFSAAGLLSVHELFGLLGADEQALPHIAAYIIPLYWGMPLLAVGIVAGSALRAVGIVKAPEIVFGIAGVINAVLDYVLIRGVDPFPAMGIKGVAFGTVTSWLFIVVIMLILLLRQRLLSISALSDGAEHLAILRQLMRLGLPSIASQLVAPLSLMYLTFLLGREASEAVAAFGVSGRIETLLMIGMMAVSAAGVPFIAQNLGAGRHVRIDDAIVFMGKAAIYLGLAVIVILVVFADPIAGLFSQDRDVIDYTKYYFYIVSLSYLFYGLYLVTAAIFNGLQLPAIALRIMLVRTILFMLPLTLIGTLFGANGIFGGLAVSNILGGMYASYVMRKQLKKVGSSLVGRNPFQDYKADVKTIWAGIRRAFTA